MVPRDDSPSCVDSKAIQDHTVGNAPPMKKFGFIEEVVDDVVSSSPEDKVDDDVVSSPEERGATCELCSVLGDVSRHQGHHLVHYSYQKYSPDYF